MVTLTLAEARILSILANADGTEMSGAYLRIAADVARGTIYVCLDRLESLGYVTHVARDTEDARTTGIRQNFYRITPAGRSAPCSPPDC